MEQVGRPMCIAHTSWVRTKDEEGYVHIVWQQLFINGNKLYDTTQELCAVNRPRPGKNEPTCACVQLYMKDSSRVHCRPMSINGIRCRRSSFKLR